MFIFATGSSVHSLVLPTLCCMSRLRMLTGRWGLEQAPDGTIKCQMTRAKRELVAKRLDGVVGSINLMQIPGLGVGYSREN